MISAFAYRQPNKLIHQWPSQDSYWALGRSRDKQDKAIASRRAAPGRPQDPTHGASTAGSGGAELRRFDGSTKDYPAIRQTHTCLAAVGISTVSEVHHIHRTILIFDAANHQVGARDGAESTVRAKGSSLSEGRPFTLVKIIPVRETAAKCETSEAGLTAEAVLSNRIVGYSDYF